MAGQRWRAAAFMTAWVLLALSFFPLLMVLFGLKLAPREADTAFYTMAGIGGAALLLTMGGGLLLLRLSRGEAERVAGRLVAQRDLAGMVLTGFGVLAALVTLDAAREDAGDDQLRMISIGLLASSPCC